MCSYTGRTLAIFCLMLISVFAAHADAACEAERDARERAEQRKDAAERRAEAAQLSSVRAQAMLDLCLIDSRRSEAACRIRVTVRDAVQRFAARARERVARRVKYFGEADERLAACVKEHPPV
jgi:hypothetical protein